MYGAIDPYDVLYFYIRGVRKIRIFATFQRMIGEKGLTAFFFCSFWMYFSQCLWFVFFNPYSITNSDAWKATTLLYVVWFTLQNDLVVHMQNRQSCGQSQFAKNLPTNLFDFKSSVASPEPDPHGYRIYFGSRRAKMAHNNRKNFEISGFEVLDVLFLRAEGFSCSLNVWRPRDK